MDETLVLEENTSSESAWRDLQVLLMDFPPESTAAVFPPGASVQDVERIFGLYATEAAERGSVSGKPGLGHADLRVHTTTQEILQKNPI